LTAAVQRGGWQQSISFRIGSTALTKGRSLRLPAFVRFGDDPGAHRQDRRIVPDFWERQMSETSPALDGIDEKLIRLVSSATMSTVYRTAGRGRWFPLDF
jgi:hypothetical protein